ncbi:MAG: hypothetical protein V4730_11940 [Pseudomonadota bacterium]
MKLTEYLDGINRADTAEALEAAIQAPFKHAFHGPTWSRICKARIARGKAICAASQHARFIPQFDARRQLSVCGETYKVGRGGNSTGIRYAWCSAEDFAIDVLKRNGLSQRAAHLIWGEWSSYPHRTIFTIEHALAGEHADPVLDTLELSYVSSAGPINYTVAQNNADPHDKRATEQCPGCKTGTLFDWGAGFSSGFTFVNWHCNGCGNVYCEHMTPTRFAATRRPRLLESAE